jgi:hypothetical protein
MAISIPSGIFEKYEEFADAMITHFGTPCKLLYADKIEVATETVDHVKQRRTMNIRDTNTPGGFGRGGTTYKTIEAEEDITLRVYYTAKDWKKIGNFDLADGSIMCIGYLTDLPKINKAHTLIVNTNAEGYEDYRFEKAGEPFPWGFRHTRYVVSTWKRT